MQIYFDRIIVNCLTIVISFNFFIINFALGNSNYNLNQNPINEQTFKKEKSLFFQNLVKEDNSESSKEFIAIRGFFMGLTISEIARLSRFTETSILQDKFLELNDTIVWPAEKVEVKSHIVIRKESIKPFKENLTVEEGESLINSIHEFYHLIPIAHRISISQLVEVAKELLTYLRKDSDFGELYDLVYHNRFFSFFRTRIIYLNSTIQKQIDLEFKNEKSLIKKIINNVMFGLIENNKLTPAEASELIALSKSTQIFEESSSMSGDLGGWSGNFKGIVASGDEQTVCHEEALMYYFFTKTLAARGLLQFFIPVGTILRMGHEATLIQNKRNKDFFVVDSWYENGGSLAHILTKEDWSQGKDDKNLISIQNN